MCVMSSEMSTATHPVVQVVAPDDVQTASFVEQLTGQKCQSSCTWHLGTKYYETDIHVQRASLGQCPEAGKWEALVLVVDQSAQKTFLSVRQWFDSNKEHFSKPAIALVVMQSMQRGESVPPWLEEAVSWCIENGFEWIRVSPDDKEWDTALHEEEGHGVHRVLEALEAHVWPGCSLKSKSTDGSLSQAPSPLASPQVPFEVEGEEMEDTFEKLLVEMSSRADCSSSAVLNLWGTVRCTGATTRTLRSRKAPGCRRFGDEARGVLCG